MQDSRGKVGSENVKQMVGWKKKKRHWQKKNKKINRKGISPHISSGTSFFFFSFSHFQEGDEEVHKINERRPVKFEGDEKKSTL
jgi:hypothetical protein